MQVEFLASFNKDISKLSSSPVRKSLKRTILYIESAKTLSDIPNLKNYPDSQMHTGLELEITG